MPRSPITWSSAPFFWPAEPALDEKSLNSPQPCQHGSNCTYKTPGKCCAFVHPGEQGSGRQLFPARVFVENGRQVYQKAQVRLIDSTFYERRSLGLSWPEWCKKVQDAPQQLQMPTPEAVHAIYQMYAQAYSQAQLKVAENYAKQQAEAAILVEQHQQTKQNIGNLLMEKVTPQLNVLKQQFEYGKNEGESWPSIMTAGKIVGMFLEAMDFCELQQLIKDNSFFEEKFGEALDVLNEFSKPVA